MNTKDGYAKKSLTSARLLTADGGDTDNYLPLTGGTMTGALVTTALSVAGAATFSLTINGSILGNAATASRLLNARTISLTGAVTGSGSFDGSANLSIATTANSIALDNLSNVTITNPVTGLVLKYNGTNWVNSSESFSSLSGLTDVSLSSLASGNILTYDGTNWINSSSVNIPANYVKYSFTKSSNTCYFTYDNSLNQLQIGGNNGIIYCSSFLYTKARWHMSFRMLGSVGGNDPNKYFIITVDNYAYQNSPYIKVCADDIGDEFTHTLIVHISNSNITTTWSVGDEFAFEYEGYGNGNNSSGMVYFYKNKSLIDSHLYMYNLCTLYIHPNNFSPTLNDILLTDFPVYHYMGQTPNTVTSLIDTVISSPTSGLFLKWNGSNWINSSLSLSLDDLSDVSIDNVADGQVLAWDNNAGNWVNTTITTTASQATSWAELGSGTNGTSKPTLSVNDTFPNSGASVDYLPRGLYYPGSDDKYYALPIIIDSSGLLFVAISASLKQLLENDGWRSISSEQEE